MAAKKTKVVFIKRVEDRDKSGEKIVIKAGSRSEMTKTELKKYEGCVRVIDDESKTSARPVLASGSAPAAAGGAGDDDDDEDEDEDKGAATGAGSGTGGN